MKAAASILATAISYVILARIGLLLDPVGGFATVVWAPTGVAIAATLLGGYRFAIGVLAGAFTANLMSGAPPVVALAIAIGNTLEAVVAVALLHRIGDFDQSLSGTRDVLAFTVAAAVAAPVISASIGVFALQQAGILAAPDAGRAWRAWWVGDAIGALVVAPVILIWHAQRWSTLTKRWTEGAAMLAATVGVAAFVFFANNLFRGTAFLQAYLVFPVLIWASMRFLQRGAVTAVLITGVIAVIGTTGGHGPFVQGDLQGALFALQTFMGIVALSFLILATVLAERERALTAASVALTAAAEANNAKADFLATMSHELRTPLNAIAGYAQLLTMDVHGPLTQQQREAVGRIDSNQQHLTSLVEDVLTFARAESGRLAVSTVPLPVADALGPIVTFVDPLAQRQQVELRVLPPPPDLVALADPDRLRQILLNLVSNAIKYTPKGGRVEVSAGRAHRGDRTVRIQVRDTGIGIASELIPKVFEPFYQVDHGKTRRYAGAGLGLTISRDLARVMGGEVELQSQLGHGTTATITLPAAPDRGI